MALIRPFKAVRPDEKSAHLVASVPYDVVNREEAAEQAKNNPLNFLRVTRSEIELDGGVDAYSEEVYKKARENYLRLKEEAPMKQDDKARFYIYRLIMDGQEQTGIAATFSVDDYNNDVIKKHEKTRKVKEDDRTNHIINTRAQTGAVFLTYKGVEEVNNAVNEITEKEKPVYDFTASDGIQHTVWIVPEDYNDIITYEIEKVDYLYIADGHHRAASAARSRDVAAKESKESSGLEEYNFFMAVLFPAEQLNILPYNRVVFDLKGKSDSEFMEEVGKSFTVTETSEKTPPERGTINMYFNGTWYLLRPNENVKEGEKVADNLDVSLLQNYILTPVLDIEDVRTDTNIDFIGGIRGTEELERLVDSGKASVAFSMYPVSVDDLINISDADEIMPPKSTWFEPKLRDGLLVHEI